MVCLSIFPTLSRLSCVSVFFYLVFTTTTDLLNDDINRLESLNLLDRNISSCYFFPRLRQEGGEKYEVGGLEAPCGREACRRGAACAAVMKMSNPCFS